MTRSFATLEDLTFRIEALVDGLSTEETRAKLLRLLEGGAECWVEAREAGDSGEVERVNCVMLALVAELAKLGRPPLSWRSTLRPGHHGQRRAPRRAARRRVARPEANASTIAKAGADEPPPSPGVILALRRAS